MCKYIFNVCVKKQLSCSKIMLKLRKILLSCLLFYQNVCHASEGKKSSLNTSYLTDSSIVFTLKFWPKMMVKSGLEKTFLKFLHGEAISFYFILLYRKEDNHKFSTKNNHLPAWRKIFLPYVLDLIHLLEQNFCPDSNLRVKTMYESVK